MALVKRNNSKFLYAQFQFQGKLYVKSTKTTNMTKAKRIERAMREQLVSEEMLGEKKPITIAEAFEHYLEHKIGQSDYSNAVGRARGWVEFLNGKKHFHSITTADLERFLRKKKREGVKPATLKHYFITFRVALKTVKRLGYAVPTVEIPVIKVHNQRLRYLSIEEENRLLEVLHPVTGRFNTPATQLRDFHIQSRWDNYHITILLLDVGARVSEISNLRWRDVNLKERTINLYRSKVSNESVLLMTTRVHEVLTRRFKNRKQSMWVFTDKSGLNARKYAPTAMKKAFAAAGLDDITQPYHVFRHTFASRLAVQGVSLQEIGLLLGHKSPETTAIYAHLQPNVTSAKATAILNDLNKSTKGPKLSVVNSPVKEQGDVNGQCSL